MAGVNDSRIQQGYTVINALAQQMEGRSALANVQTGNFTSVANTVLKQGYDSLLTAISQLMTRTIYSSRPYSAKFRGLEVSEQRYGLITRKLTALSRDWTADEQWRLQEGVTIDQYSVRKPYTMQTNFYGGVAASFIRTQYRDQLDQSFNNADELGRFWAMHLTESQNEVETRFEAEARGAIINFIGGILAGGKDTQKVHLITEYNAATNSQLTAATAFAPENVDDFVKWMYARIKTASDLMEERTNLWHVTPTSYTDTQGNVTTYPNNVTILRHTPKNKQKLLMLADILNQIQTRVLSSVFQRDAMDQIRYITANYWQSIKTRDSINTLPTYMTETGALDTPKNNIEQGGIVGVLFDEEALGVTKINGSVEVTPYNAVGKYWNYVYSFTNRWWNDFTENGIVFLLD